MGIKLPMSNGDIVMSYKQAADPDRQIGILTELNACSKYDIKRILRDAGVLDARKAAIKDEPIKSKRPSRRTWDTAFAMALYEEGNSDQDICFALGIGIQAVRVWRKQNNLPANPSGRMRTCAATEEFETEDTESSMENPEIKIEKIVSDLTETAAQEQEDPRRIYEDHMKAIKTERALKTAEKMTRVIEATETENPQLMRAVELTFELLNKIWERI